MANEQNLRPAKKGEVRNPKGKPKGTKHLSTHIQNMLNDPEFSMLISDPKEGYKEYKGVPIKAIIQVAIRKAVAGDDRAMEWLAKHGYGSNINLSVQVSPAKEILAAAGLLEESDDGEAPSNPEGPSAS